MATGQANADAIGFHSGELAVQRRAGVQAEAARLRPMMAPGELRGGAPAFLAHASFAALTARDRDGRLWTSPLIGPPGFMTATTATRLSLRDVLPVGDPLHGLPENQPVGIVVMEFAAKRRVRINGTLVATGAGTLEVDVVQAYGNCPQYIHPRRISAESGASATDPDAERGVSLSADDIALIRSADTFFLGTTHPDRGNDASHRGGPAGFVRADATTVEWPDYPGNNMFNSFGNLEIDPTAALLFMDFDSGRTLALSGRAVVDWEKSAERGDTGRWVRFTAESVVRSRRA
jgi:predicted pyridoxine 5'-phosphate oxidase superfamily flavin-nucleotide-binding protein